MNSNCNEMRIAIIASNCGGSEIAAEVVQSAVLKRFPHAEATLVFIDDLWPGRVIFGVDWYLALARLEWYRLIHYLIGIEKRIFGLMEKRFRMGLTKKLIRTGEAPHLIISTIPFINPSLLALAKEKKIPLFVLATDIDCELYSFEWPQDADLPPYRFGVFCDHVHVISQLNPAVDRSKVVFTGGFVREEFTRVYSKEEKRGFCQELGLPADREIVTFMMGSLGGKQLGDYVRRILDGVDQCEFLGEPHFVSLCGKSSALKRLIEHLIQRRGYLKTESGIYQRPFGKVSFSIEGYTGDVYKYFAVSKGVVTKPGGGSVNEVLALNLPLIIDNIHGQLPWEKLTSRLLAEQGLAVVVNDLSHLPNLINGTFLAEKRAQALIARQIAFLEKNPSPHAFAKIIGNTAEILMKEKRESTLATAQLR